MVICETKCGLLIYCSPSSKLAFVTSTYFPIRMKTRKEFQEHTRTKRSFMNIFLYPASKAKGPLYKTLSISPILRLNKGSSQLYMYAMSVM